MITPSPCFDCGIDTTPCTNKRGCRHIGRWEYYMVTEDVWAETGLWDNNENVYLCIGCLERRIGYTLSAEDFTDVPINAPHPWNTPRLADRIAR